MPNLDRAKRLAHTVSTPGWQDVLQMMTSQGCDYRDTLYDIMATKPDTLTGKKAISLAARAKALEDFRESIEDELKILDAPNPKGRGE